MNKSEKLFAFLLAALLVGWFLYSQKQAVAQAQAARAQQQEAAFAAATNEAARVASPTGTVIRAAAPAVPAAVEPPVPAPVVKPTLPEETLALTNGQVTATFSSWGGVLKSLALKGYAQNPGKVSAKNPEVVLDFASAPALALGGIPGLPPNASYSMEKGTNGTSVTFSAATAQGLMVSRKLELLPNYRFRVTDSFRNAGKSVLALGTNTVGLGVMGRGESKNEILSADSLPAAAGAKTHYWGSEKATKTYLAGGAVGGCGGAPSAAGMPPSMTVPISEPQKWVAIKSRFFVTVLESGAPNTGFSLTATRDESAAKYLLTGVSARMNYPNQVLSPGEGATRAYSLFIGPKKLSLLRAMGDRLDDIMEFGFFGWFCKLLLPTLNFFYDLIPNYGVAIILLTFLVRIIFWPLTRSSTQSMKKMQEIQPKLKEIQKKFKDNPQKLQQETWAVYRENKVNPLSSCLPMLIQIPVFIALFTVLRSSVELRYSSFLWITDLSEPENLFSGSIPIIGSLNILPILMAATTGLQSYLTPAAGDPNQQRMMSIFMPLMMLFMFYSFPSALSLYWTVSQVLSIVQMLEIRYKNEKAGKGGVTPPPPDNLTRQQKRAAARA